MEWSVSQPISFEGATAAADIAQLGALSGAVAGSSMQMGWGQTTGNQQPMLATPYGQGTAAAAAAAAGLAQLPAGIYGAAPGSSMQMEEDEVDRAFPFGEPVAMRQQQMQLHFVLEDDRAADDRQALHAAASDLHLGLGGSIEPLVQQALRTTAAGRSNAVDQDLHDINMQSTEEHLWLLQ